MKTIRRNAHRKIAAIALTIVQVRMYDQSAGEMVESTVNAAFWNLGEYDFAKLYDHEDGKYTIHVHSNKFFYLYTQAHLDQAAAEKAERDARYAAEREQWTAIAAPAEKASVCEYGNNHQVETCPGCGTEDADGNQIEKPAPVASFAPGTKVLWRDNRTECGTVTEDGNPVVIVETIDGPQGVMAGRLVAAEPSAVTVTRTRMAIGDQISQACTALGIKLGHGWNKGTASYLVKGRDYTAGELADLVLEGGFAANYGGNEVRVNWNSPLRPLAQTSTDKVSESLERLKDATTKLREAGTAPADALEQIEGVMRLMRDELHSRAAEEAPREEIDFPSGAAEPDKTVTAVRCVRTGRVWERDYTSWTCREIGFSTGWYYLNIIDPMSEGFNIYRKES